MPDDLDFDADELAMLRQPFPAEAPAALEPVTDRIIATGRATRDLTPFISPEPRARHDTDGLSPSDSMSMRTIVEVSGGGDGSNAAIALPETISDVASDAVAVPEPKAFVRVEPERID